ncbi:uncharacterized protein LOC101461948 [Ceratitis capitata]|uniref:uncharacterized protein LOC101461948 n=1 Tax=Ceratitis capitata TaxID=7213 RepID=UPI000329E917|nr:uncharacterized protein LOC101461948 [Ceratitis capitata]XP_020717308.1 uncharacterized protein LOC101461948 [Ceratitis capitata]XP_020717309.1 uncharacterized protein LOC101461948 [Ceratitis capitata]
MDWRHSEVMELICMYRQYECLWNCHSPDYKQQDMKKSAWIELSNHFEKEVDEVKKKIKHLRNSYTAEKKKVDKIKSLSGKAYEPRLYYYNQMTFLDPVIILRVFDQDNIDDPLAENKSLSSNNDRIVSTRKRQSSDSFDIDEEATQMELSSSRMLSDTDESASPSPQLVRTTIKRRLIVDDMPNRLSSSAYTTTKTSPPTSSKEDTFCAMLCSELKLLKSEETYDNVTTEIFNIVKSAKIAERQIDYQPECSSNSRRY